jgi:hypothetical protein
MKQNSEFIGYAWCNTRFLGVFFFLYPQSSRIHFMAHTSLPRFSASSPIFFFDFSKRLAFLAFHSITPDAIATANTTAPMHAATIGTRLSFTLRRDSGLLSMLLELLGSEDINGRVAS